MATCTNCGKKDTKILIRAEGYKENYLGWCKQCIDKEMRQLRQEGIEKAKGVWNSIFG